MSETENTIEVGSPLFMGDISVCRMAGVSKMLDAGTLDCRSCTHIIRNGTILKVVPKKEPLVWAGEVGSSITGNTVAFLPDAFAGKTVEVREITEPEPAPELDLSPLTENEFRRLQIGDVVIFQQGGSEKRVNQVEVNELGEFQFTHLFRWAFREGPWIPSEETARRLGRGVKR